MRGCLRKITRGARSCVKKWEMCKISLFHMSMTKMAWQQRGCAAGVWSRNKATEGGRWAGKRTSLTSARWHLLKWLGLWPGPLLQKSCTRWHIFMSEPSHFLAKTMLVRVITSMFLSKYCIEQYYSFLIWWKFSLNQLLFVYSIVCKWFTRV